MSQEIWNKVDDYLDRMIVDQDHALLAALKDSEEADLPPINVSPPQGKMLHILARSLSAKRILEMGSSSINIVAFTTELREDLLSKAFNAYS